MPPLSSRSILVAILLLGVAPARGEDVAPEETSAAASESKAAEAVKGVPKEAWKPGQDTSVVYRFDPVTQSYAVIARKDLKRDHVYYRYSDRLGTWVWSKLDRDGVLRYAMGPGSSQPAALFDMPASSEQRAKALEKQAPELAKRLAISGAKPSLRLGDDGRWALMPDSTRGRVFDLETGERFEWHGNRIVAVTHGTGTNLWRRGGGNYLPVGAAPRFSIPPAYDR